MNLKVLLVLIAGVVALGLGVGLATAAFLTDSGSADRTHTMQDGQTMMGSMGSMDSGQATTP